MSKTLPDSSTQHLNMTETEKIQLLAKHMSCDQCNDCQGWRSVDDLAQDTSCICGHDVDQHIDQKQDFERRLDVALKIDELLKVIDRKKGDCLNVNLLSQEKGKVDDYDYIDNDIMSLKK